MRGPQIQFLWVPAHSGIEGNEKANTLASSITTESEGAAALPASTCMASRASSSVKEIGAKHWAELYAATKGGKHTRDLGRALPSAHKGIIIVRSAPSGQGHYLGSASNGNMQTKVLPTYMLLGQKLGPV